MAITSVGYDGTVDEVQWASMVSKVGGYEYGVDGANHFAVSQSAGTRMVSVASGLAWGRGVMDISDAAAVIQLDSVSTGSRYDLIALRRTWGPANGGPTEIVVIKGTSSKGIPSGRQKNPGVIDDQPLALVRVAAGSSAIPEVIDLRVWGRNGGQLFAKDDLVRSYIDAIGTEININGTLWQRTVGSNNVAVWTKHGLRRDTGWIRTTSGFLSGWGGADSYMRYRIVDKVCYFRIRFNRTGGTITYPSDGNLANVQVATAPTPPRPSDDWMALHAGAQGGLAAGTITPAGSVNLTAVAPNLSIKNGTEFSLNGMYFVD
ncbi:hypothetical protein [Glutamicibacter sp. M10]|uniref:hypothetical protein n=1 Tax=Glutamicibacter sp. M10 TaxID=3023076 RepID=UPI0021C8C90C|nr:hypothetical protein [Glutamicibacter sp. M10]UXN31017.1 hypothetical protein N6V40_11360 [Glutamicibacter sp. M10]